MSGEPFFLQIRSPPPRQLTFPRNSPLIRKFSSRQPNHTAVFGVHPYPHVSNRPDGPYPGGASIVVAGCRGSPNNDRHPPAYLRTGFELSKGAIAGPGRRNPAMSPTTTSRTPPIFQHITATKKSLRDVIIDRRCVWRGERCVAPED